MVYNFPNLHIYTMTLIHETDQNTEVNHQDIIDDFINNPNQKIAIYKKPDECELSTVIGHTTDIVKIINNYEAKSFGFASSNFYAEFLAALIVEQNAEKYFPGIVRESPIEFDEIRVPKSLSFRNTSTRRSRS